MALPTYEEILAWSPAEMKRQMQIPGRIAEIEAVLNSPENQTPEEQAAAALEETERLAAEAAAAAEVVPQQTDEEILQEQQAVQQAAVDAQAVQQEQAEREALLKAAGITVETDSNGRVVKIVQKYQAKDERDNPIGEPTYLQAKSWEELAVKQQTAHINATRFGERMKRKAERQPATPRAPEPKAMTDEELTALVEAARGEDPKVAAQAMRKIASDEANVQLQVETAKAQAAVMTTNWMRKHMFDFNPCLANSNQIISYIEGDNPEGTALEYNEANLDAALEARTEQGKLASVTIPERFLPAAQPTINPAPTQPVTAEPVVPAVQPSTVAPTAPVVPAARPNVPAVVVPRPGVNGGLVPGAQSGVRQTAQPKGLTRAEVIAWSPAQMKIEMKKPGRKAEIERVMNAK